MLVLNSIIDLVLGIEVSINLKDIALSLLGLRGRYELIPWFLFCIFSSEIMLYGIMKICKKFHVKYFVLPIILISVGFLYGTYIRQVLPWSIDIAIMAMGFITLGFTFKQYNLVNKFVNIKLSLIYLILFAIGNILVLTNENLTGINMYSNQYGHFYTFALTTFFGIAFVTSISSKIKSKFLVLLGRNTMTIYIIHYFFLGISERIVNYYPSLNNYITGFITMILAVLLSLGTSLLINKYCPFLLGKWKSRKESK